jgi:enoyl-[acyl-carrier-protein] reductase (NADH)
MWKCKGSLVVKVNKNYISLFDTQEQNCSKKLWPCPKCNKIYGRMASMNTSLSTFVNELTEIQHLLHNQYMLVFQQHDLYKNPILSWYVITNSSMDIQQYSINRTVKSARNLTHNMSMLLSFTFLTSFIVTSDSNLPHSSTIFRK